MDGCKLGSSKRKDATAIPGPSVTRSLEKQCRLRISRTMEGPYVDADIAVEIMLLKRGGI